MVLAHNGSELTVDCLRSLEAADWPSLRVVVVDNASSDETPEVVTECFPHVTLVRSDTNLGYAGGNNLGFARALSEPCDYVLVLNNDTLVDQSAIRSLVAVARSKPNAGAILPLITYAEDPDIVWNAGADYDPRRGYPGRVRHYGKRVAAAGLVPGFSDRFTGAAVLLPRAVLEEVGGFADDLFFLYEDVDLSLRIRRSGHCLWFSPEAVVRHRVAMTQGGEHSPSSFYYGLRNQLIVAQRHAPAGPIRTLWRTAVAVGVHVARLRHAPKRLEALAAVPEALRDQYRGRSGPRDR